MVDPMLFSALGSQLPTWVKANIAFNTSNTSYMSMHMSIHMCTHLSTCMSMWHVWIAIHIPTRMSRYSWVMGKAQSEVSEPSVRCRSTLMAVAAWFYSGSISAFPKACPLRRVEASWSLLILIDIDFVGLYDRDGGMATRISMACFYGSISARW